MAQVKPIPLPPIDYACINPGIRRTVDMLRAAGFDTQDSGDGVTKSYACDIGVPYVHMLVPSPAALVTEADRLMTIVETLGVVLEDQNEQGTAKQVTADYTPHDGLCFLTLWNVTDADLWPATGEAAGA